MKNKQGILIAAVAAFLLIAAYFTFARGNGAGIRLPTLGTSNSDEVRLDQMESSQKQQYEALNNKIDRLADAMLERGPVRSAPATKQARLPGGLMGNPRELEERRARLQADLDKRLQAEPVAKKWAVESTRTIEQALTAASLKEIGAGAPIATDIDCRTSMCRIDMVYANGGDAADAGVMLNMAIAERMPFTQVVQQRHPDGTFDYIIYASKTRP
jgi:hypothetical protein